MKIEALEQVLEQEGQKAHAEWKAAKSALTQYIVATGDEGIALLQEMDEAWERMDKAFTAYEKAVTRKWQPGTRH